MLLDLVTPHMSPIHKVLQRLGERSCGEVPDLLIEFFQVEDRQRAGAQYDLIRKTVLSLAASVHFRLEWPILTYPICLLQAVRADGRSPDEVKARATSVMTQLLDADDCCLDPCFSERLRNWAKAKAEAESREDGEGMRERELDVLTSDVVVGILRSWSSFGHMSVGHVERLHSVMKHLIGRSTVRPSIEGVLYLGHLRRLMSRFLENPDNLDFSMGKNNVEYARRLGLLTRAMGKSKAKAQKGHYGQRYSRVRRFINIKSRLAKIQRGVQGSARARKTKWTLEDQAAAEAIWRTEFGSMSEEALESFFNMYDGFAKDTPSVDVDLETQGQEAVAPPSDPPGGDLLDLLEGGPCPEQVPPPPPPPPSGAALRHHRASPCHRISDSTWPVSSEACRTFLQGKIGRESDGPFGISACSRKIRPELRDHILVGEATDTPVPQTPFRAKVPCSVLHPGLCRARNADVFQEALQVAGSIRAAVNAYDSGTMLRIVSQFAGSPSRVEYFSLGVVRLRDPAIAEFAAAKLAPEIHASAVVLECVSGDSEDDIFDDRFVFKSCYRIAGELLSAKPMSVKLQIINVLSASVAHVMLKCDEELVASEAMLYPLAKEAQASSSSSGPSAPSSSAADGVVDLLDMLDKGQQKMQKGPVRPRASQPIVATSSKQHAKKVKHSGPRKASAFCDVGSDDSVSCGNDESDLDTLTLKEVADKDDESADDLKKPSFSKKRKGAAPAQAKPAAKRRAANQPPGSFGVGLHQLSSRISSVPDARSLSLGRTALKPTRARFVGS